jgi:hypothetical protein
VSFASIGAVWFAHTVITEYLHYTNQVFVRVVMARTRRLTPGLAGYVVFILLPFHQLRRRPSRR